MNNIHIIGTHRNPSCNEVTGDAFARAAYHLTTQLYRKGFHVKYYGFEESTVECFEKYNVASFKAFEKSSESTRRDLGVWRDNPENELEFINKTKELLLENCKEGDILLVMWSTYIKHLVDLKTRGVKIIDAHIGHNVWPNGADWNVFTSHSWRHYQYGKEKDFAKNIWNDTVIAPISNSINDFKFKEEKEDYFLFMSRLNNDKGLPIFFDLATFFPDKKFILAGQGKPPKMIHPNMEFVGYLDLEDRKKYIANAKAMITPTYYIEPFGLTASEAALSGTPIITTDWGGYTDNVINGKTGFRCHYFADFVEAINKIDTISPHDCRKHGEKFTAESLINKWIDYLNNVNKSDWYEKNDKDRLTWN